MPITRFSPTRRRTVAYTAAAAVIAAGCAVPATVAAVASPGPIRLHPPEPTGPHAVGRADLHLVDESRGHPWVEGAKQRDLMVSVWYPAEDSGGEPPPYMPAAVAGVLSGELEQLGVSRDAVDVAGTTTDARAGADVADDAEDLPVLLYSHGFNQSRHQATAQLEELASQGYAVVAMDHPYESSAVELPGGRVIRDAIPEAGADTMRTAVATRVADTRFVLDAVEEIAGGGDPAEGGQPLPDGLGAALDPSSVAMFGHSAGGLTAAEAMLVDDRIDAGVNLDGSIAYHVGDEEWADATLQGAERPFMIFSGGLSGGSGDPHTSEYSPDWRMFRAASTGPFLELHMPDAEHMSFIDTQWMTAQIEEGLDPDGRAWEDGVESAVGTVGARPSIAAQRAYLTAYFDEHLRGRERPLLDGPSAEYPEVEFVE
ncbi:alpha/beta hydrolase family protein [Streptomonospora wellingtoniae]|uniref:Alpha/beta hydrolase n=1 Tax=Streptomonospora wellingtoniae TaxID=3075544 RepID=A0ABU2KWL6_9ACTN|nr:alpha/beta hydrolase [Streptomonospora sp. DSM 45055]MDT0303691.1 alpha/beta hydrolase [Streptomonospora sp. DSM 45055]